MKIYIDKNGDNWIALLLSLTPFLMNYKMPFVGINLATLVFLCLIAIEFLHLMAGKRKEQHLQICFSKLFIIVMSLYMIAEYLIIHNLKSYQGSLQNNFSDVLSFVFVMYGLVVVTTTDIRQLI